MPNFRELSSDIGDKLDELHEDAKNVTGRDSTNATLNYAVNLAYQRLQNLNSQRRDAQQQKLNAAGFANE